VPWPQAAAGNKPVRTQAAFSISTTHSDSARSISSVLRQPSEKRAGRSGRHRRQLRQRQGSAVRPLDQSAIWDSSGWAWRVVLPADGVDAHHRARSAPVSVQSVPHRDGRHRDGNGERTRDSPADCLDSEIWPENQDPALRGTIVFRLTQNVVTGLKLDDPYPHDTATLTAW